MDNFVQLTTKNFDEYLDHYNFIILDFTADWCEPCQSFGTLFEAAAQEFKHVLFAKINVGQEQELASDFNVRSIPTIIILRYRVAVFMQSGIISAQELNRLIKEADVLTQADVEIIYDAGIE